MSPIHPQCVVDENQERRAVLLSLEDWERILDELEELDDIRACDDASRRGEDFVPFEQAMRDIEEGRDG